MYMDSGDHLLRWLACSFAPHSRIKFCAQFLHNLRFSSKASVFHFKRLAVQLLLLLPSGDPSVRMHNPGHQSSKYGCGTIFKFSIFLIWSYEFVSPKFKSKITHNTTRPHSSDCWCKVVHYLCRWHLVKWCLTPTTRWDLLKQRRSSSERAGLT